MKEVDKIAFLLVLLALSIGLTLKSDAVPDANISTFRTDLEASRRLALQSYYMYNKAYLDSTRPQLDYIVSTLDNRPFSNLANTDYDPLLRDLEPLSPLMERNYRKKK